MRPRPCGPLSIFFKKTKTQTRAIKGAPGENELASIMKKNEFRSNFSTLKEKSIIRVDKNVNSTWRECSFINVSLLTSESNDSNFVHNSMLAGTLYIQKNKNYTCTHNLMSEFLYVMYSGGNIINHNVIDSGFFLIGKTSEDFVQQEVWNNSCQGKEILYIRHVIDDAITGDYGQIIMVNCSLITIRQYEHAARMLAEIGRLLGGWIKSESG